MTFEEVLEVGVCIWEEDLLPYYDNLCQLDLKFE